MCRAQRVGTCPCGFIDDGLGFCIPQSGSCASPGCTSDAQCAAGAVCTSVSGQSCGVCVQRCRWDFSVGDLVAPGCPPGQTCWVDAQNLAPQSPVYGAGRCRPPCSSDQECQQLATNPNGGPSLVCRDEALGTGARSLLRCRGSGACMDEAECPSTPPSVPERGYCDRSTRSCQTGCRVGTNPTTLQSYDDCRDGLVCRNDGGVSFCAVRPCTEGGGFQNCASGFFCCGEDRNRDGVAEPCPPPAEREPNGCFRAPIPPFCQTCTSGSDCATVPLPAWLTCANGAPNLACSPMPSACVPTRRASGATGPGVCAPATQNDVSLTVAGTIERWADRGCPGGVGPTPIRVRVGVDAGSPDSCSTDADCRLGNTAGRCGTDPFSRLPDGGIVRSCLCMVSGTPSCPNGAGVTSVCLDGVPGASSVCITALACVLPPALLFRDAGPGAFGCGL